MLLSTNLLNEGILLHFLTSTCAGTVATTICAPFDVVKSRVSLSVLRAQSHSLAKLTFVLSLSLGSCRSCLRLGSSRYVFGVHKFNGRWANMD